MGNRERKKRGEKFPKRKRKRYICLTVCLPSLITCSLSVSLGRRCPPLSRVRACAQLALDSLGNYALSLLANLLCHYARPCAISQRPKETKSTHKQSKQTNEVKKKSRKPPPPPPRCIKFSSRSKGFLFGDQQSIRLDFFFSELMDPPPPLSKTSLFSLSYSRFQQCFLLLPSPPFPPFRRGGSRRQLCSRQARRRAGVGAGRGVMVVDRGRLDACERGWSLFSRGC
jgi:hypothetical protein